MKFIPNCATTAMGIMPHTDIDRAIALAMSLDVPFWPQLPKVSYLEDMYAQTSQNFPGVAIDVDNEKVSFSAARFEQELADYSQKADEPQTFALTKEYSRVFSRFLEADLSRCLAVRGQLTGPVSFGFRVVDEGNKPIIYNEGVRAILFDFIQRKTNWQYRQLRAKNANAFVWLDEPGLGWVFSGMSGYDDVLARQDYQAFLQGLEGPKALHLCANVNLPYLLGLGVEILSFDAYQMEVMPAAYAGAVAEYINRGGIISWGIVPTDSTSLGRETPETLAGRLSGYWQKVAAATGLSLQQIGRQALIAPARCCLKNIGQVGGIDDVAKNAKCEAPTASVEERLVETAFAYLPQISGILRTQHNL